MMTESFSRRTWDVPRPPSERSAVAESKRPWLKAFRPYAPAAPNRAVASQASASMFLKTYPIILIVLIVVGLFALGAVIAIALIPLYLANHSGPVNRVYSE